MLKHGVIFTHNKQEIVLLLDRVTLSLDDKHDDEFIFATINDNHIDKTLYFVISNDSYVEFKKQYPKVKLAGFWHSLFANGKINLTVTEHCLISDELVYNLLLKDDELSTSFIISQDENLSSNIDTNSSLSKFDELISPADKVKKQKLERTIKLFAMSIFWLLIVISLYFYTIQKDNEILLITQKISDTKQKIAIADNQIIQQKKSIYKPSKAIKNNIEKLLFLRFKDIILTGEVNLNDNIKVESNSDIELLKALTQQNTKYTLKRHAEALPTLEFNHE
jgi:hypothetical protein